MNNPELLALVQTEMLRQQQLWGIQDHPQAMWMTILMEEVGEAAHAALEDDVDNYEEELVQVAAVAMSALKNFKHQQLVKQEMDNVIAALEDVPIGG
jgi:NTP pyrophosphatase (non-canonical NTP hydrolase)